MKIFFTGCHHFCHSNILKYCNRPFKSVEEMDETMIANWNHVVGVNDTIYHLGDFGLGDVVRLSKTLRQLNGVKKFLIGSHDSCLQEIAVKNKLEFMLLYKAEILGFQYTLTHEKQKIILNHCSMRVWPASHYNSWHLFSHSHGRLEPWGKSFDVGVDNWACPQHPAYTPYSFEEVLEIMSTLKDNFNLVKRI